VRVRRLAGSWRDGSYRLHGHRQGEEGWIESPLVSMAHGMKHTRGTHALSSEIMNMEGISQSMRGERQ